MKKIKKIIGKIINIDPRPKRQNTTRCKACGALNYEYVQCYMCHSNMLKLRNIVVRYRTGNKEYTRQDYFFAKDFVQKNYKDFVQPYIYDKQQKQIIKNPDYIKYYGDPESK